MEYLIGSSRHPSLFALSIDSGRFDQMNEEWLFTLLLHLFWMPLDANGRPYILLLRLESLDHATCSPAHNTQLPSIDHRLMMNTIDIPFICTIDTSNSATRFERHLVTQLKEFSWREFCQVRMTLNFSKVLY